MSCVVSGGGELSVDVRLELIDIVFVRLRDHGMYRYRFDGSDPRSGYMEEMANALSMCILQM